MKKIIPQVVLGEVIVLWMQERNSASEAFPKIVTVQAVHRGSLVVPEPKSCNGLARIVCTGDNASSDGKYWYEYQAFSVENYILNPKALKGQSLDVIRMEKFNGSQIIGPFLTEVEDESSSRKKT